MPEIKLKGCTPVPLAAYLKALGVFRIVAEQKDQQARGFWQNEIFLLDTVLTAKNLACFFLDEYVPSPIISPWNGGSGFFQGDNKKGFDSLREARADRFTIYREAIAASQNILSNLHLMERPEGAVKHQLIGILRAESDDYVLRWLDAAVVLTSDSLAFPPLLGSGGNDGRLDFTNNFMQRLVDLVDPESGAARQGAVTSLEAALWGSANTSAGKGAIGQFAPGAAGGPNATAGFDRETLINAWDYVLMLEGALMFAANTTRRLLSTERGALSFPFTVRTTGAAGGAAATPDEGGARGEVWLPLWERPATFAEISSLMSEGRATLGRRPARDGLDFARAVAALGINRGIASFQRYGFLQRSGKAYVATPMGRIRVRRNPKADLLNDLDQARWLQRFRAHVRSKDATGRLLSISRRLDEAIFGLTQLQSTEAVHRVLIAVGEAAAYLAMSPKGRDPKGANMLPLARLRQDWYFAADDGTPEFRIAAALAGLGRGTQTENSKEHEASDEDQSAGVEEADEPPGPDENSSGSVDNRAQPTQNARLKESLPPPFRAHLAPLDERSWYRRYRAWSDTDRLAVWGAGGLERNLASILERRLLFASRHRLKTGPCDGRAAADLASILAYLAEDTDDGKIAALAQGLAWAEPPNFIPTTSAPPKPLPLPYALIKPLFVPAEQLRRLGALPEGGSLSIPPELVRRLRAGDVGAAVKLACRRARASGLPVTFEPWEGREVGRLDGQRLLASLLIPIREMDVRRVLERAYPALFDEVESSEPKGEPANAA